jgi:hypothetical protein
MPNISILPAWSIFLAVRGNSSIGTG